MSDKAMTIKETYLGDGLYASYDGYQVRLWAPREQGVHEVFLEPYILGLFLDFLKTEKIIERDKP